MNFKKAADGLNFFGCMVAIFVLVPTWFEPLQGSNSVVANALLFIMSVQVLLLRMASRNKDT